MEWKANWWWCVMIQESSNLRLPVGWYYESLLEEIEWHEGEEVQEVCIPLFIPSHFFGKCNANRGLFVFSVGKPQSLFAKLGKKNFEQSSSAEQKEDTGEGQQ